MALSFKILHNGDFEVTDKSDTKTSKAVYSKSLKAKKVNGGDWMPTTTDDLDWFETYYRTNFNKITN